MNAVTTENVTRGKPDHALQIDTLCCQQKEDNYDMSTVRTTVVKSMSWDEETSNSAKKQAIFELCLDQLVLVKWKIIKIP